MFTSLAGHSSRVVAGKFNNDGFNDLALLGVGASIPIASMTVLASGKPPATTNPAAAPRPTTARAWAGLNECQDHDGVPGTDGTGYCCSGANGSVNPKIARACFGSGGLQCAWPAIPMNGQCVTPNTASEPDPENCDTDPATCMDLAETGGLILYTSSEPGDPALIDINSWDATSCKYDAENPECDDYWLL
jgi:hypothetical protein